jgi:hypothetical protein
METFEPKLHGNKKHSGNQLIVNKQKHQINLLCISIAKNISLRSEISVDDLAKTLY